MSKSPIQKPNIDYDPKRSVSSNEIKRTSIVFEPPVINKSYLLNHIKLAKENIEKTLEVYESSALKYAVTTNNSVIDSASESLNSYISNSKNITYPTYLYSLTQDGVSANLVASVYESKSIGLWGNYSIKAIKLLDKANRELDSIEKFLNSTEIEDSPTYPIIMQNVNVARGISEAIRQIKNPKISIDDIKKEYKGYTREELIGVQVALNEQITRVGEKLERDEALLKSEVADTASYYYDNVASRSLNSGINFANKTGKFSNIIRNFIGLLDSEQNKLNDDLTNRAIAFSEQAVKLADDIVELATLQIYNQAIVEVGGAEEIDISETYRDLPDQLVVDQYIGQLTGDNAMLPFVSNISDRSLADARNIFVESDKFNYLKSLVFWGSTTEINGGNIKAGTIEAGALRIGDRPLSLSIIWGENQETAGPENPEVPMHLSHSSGLLLVNIDGVLSQFSIPAAEVLVEDGTTTPSIDETSYWIYLSLNDPTDGSCKIIAREYGVDSKPDGDLIIVIGIWRNENGLGSLMTSYGSTIINGNSIMTGTVVADTLRIGGGIIASGSELLGLINESIDYTGNFTIFEKLRLRNDIEDAGNYKIALEASAVYINNEDSVVSEKNAYDIAYAEFASLLTDPTYLATYEINLTRDTNLSDPNVIALNEVVSNYFEKREVLAGKIGFYYTNETGTVNIDNEGISISYINPITHEMQGSNSLFTINSLAFKFASGTGLNWTNQDRVLISDEGTILSNTILSNNTTIENNVRLPGNIQLGLDTNLMDVTFTSDKVFINFI